MLAKLYRIKAKAQYRRQLGRWRLLGLLKLENVFPMTLWGR
jgi:hypothetical protein